MTDQFLPLPEDDDALIFRADAWLYGLPRQQTLAKWSCYPEQAPCPLPYTMVGRKAALTAGTLRKLREALTFRHSAEKAEAQRARRSSSAQPEAA